MPSKMYRETRPRWSRMVSVCGVCLTTVLLAFACSAPLRYDLILRNGTIYDGSGAKPIVGDLAIQNDEIVAIGDLSSAAGTSEIDVQGLAVAPGFVNMMCWHSIS